MNVFIDTNIVIDIYQSREPHYKAASAIFQYAVDGRINLMVSATTIVNTFYILRKQYPKDELYAKMKDLSRLVTITDVESKAIIEALEQEWKDFEDCVQYFSAGMAGADVIITRNKNDFELVGIPVMTPIDFLDSLNSND